MTEISMLTEINAPLSTMAFKDVDNRESSNGLFLKQSDFEAENRSLARVKTMKK